MLLVQFAYIHETEDGRIIRTEIGFYIVNDQFWQYKEKNILFWFTLRRLFLKVSQVRSIPVVEIRKTLKMVFQLLCYGIASTQFRRQITLI